jgi:hypothetical protein
MSDDLPGHVRNIGRVVAAIQDMALSDGKITYIVTCQRERAAFPQGAYSTHTSVYWNDQYGQWACAGQGHYDMDRGTALADMCERAGIRTANTAVRH